MKGATFYKINEIIRGLYDDDVSVYNRINNFFHNIYEFLYYDRCAILFFGKDTNGEWFKHSSISVNWEKLPTPIERYKEYYVRIDDVLPIMAQDTPIVFRCSQFFDMEKRMNSKYFKEFCLANNCVYSIEGNLQTKSNTGLKCSFFFYRGVEKNDFSEEEEEIIRLFQPHLSQVLKHYGDTPDSTSIMSTLESYNCVATVLLDSCYHIIRSSNVFKEMEHSHEENFLNEKIMEACIAMNKCKKDVQNAPFEFKGDESPFYIEIMRVQAGGLKEESHYLCLIFDLSRFFNKTIDSAKDQYMLTEREFHVFQMIVKGRSVEEIAGALYLSIPTVKKYLSCIYDKLQIKNQKQILEKLNLT